ncbi:MAG: hypothetical protein J6S40_00775 [Thermoguttaceae bacterium]|nr:hypothetical protein [Thermoguttaceae bacterium]
MNLVGKIFVSLIAIMSIIFFSLSLTLYANHKNWKEDSAAKQQQIAQLDKEKSTLAAQKQDLENKIAKEREAYEATIGALHDVVQDLQVQNDTLTEREQQTEKDLQQRLDVIAANNAAIKDYQDTLKTMTDDLAATQTQRADYLQELATAVNRLHELASIRGDLEQKNLELTQEFDRAKTVLNMNGLEPTPELYDQNLPFQVKGTIQAVQEGPRGLVMITLGSDDGLKPGHRLSVARGDSYLGKIEVVTVEPHRAVCRVLPEFRQGTIKEGDDVVSKFE